MEEKEEKQEPTVGLDLAGHQERVGRGTDTVRREREREREAEKKTHGAVGRGSLSAGCGFGHDP